MSTSRGSVFTKPLFKMVSQKAVLLENGEGLDFEKMRKVKTKEVEEIMRNLTRGR